MTKAELLEAAKILFADLVSGQELDDISDISGWDAEQAEKVKKEMLSGKADELRAKSAETTYIEYLIDQKRNVKDLTDMIKNLDSRRQYNAIVGSIRLRAELTDRILDRGIEFGLIKKGPGAGGLGSGNTFIIGGVDVNVMGAPELRKSIEAQVTELGSMMERFGDSRPMAELTTGALHYGAAVEIEAEPEVEVVAEVVADVSKKRGKKRRSID